METLVYWYGSDIVLTGNDWLPLFYGVAEPEANVVEIDAAGTYTGTDGVEDIFVLDYIADENGAFATFGEVIIDNYDLADGDKIKLVEAQGNAANTVEEFNAAGGVVSVQANAGDALINFNGDPDVVGFADQSIELMGIALDQLLCAGHGTRS